MPARKKSAKKVRQAEARQDPPKIGPIRLPAIAEDKLTRRAARADERDRVGPARHVQDERAVLLLSALAGASASSRRSSAPICASAPRSRRGCPNSRSSPPRITWKAQYEWAAHEPQALKAGVKPETIEDLRAGREPKSAPKDERTLYAFIKEVYRTGRASDRAYKAAHAILGDAGMVELVGLLGYYGLVAMTLNVFRMPVPDGTPLPFKEPAVR